MYIYLCNLTMCMLGRGFFNLKSVDCVDIDDDQDDGDEDDVDVPHLLLWTIVRLPCAIELGKPASLPGFELWCSCGQGDLET